MWNLSLVLLVRRGRVLAGFRFVLPAFLVITDKAFINNINNFPCHNFLIEIKKLFLELYTSGF